ncbi:alpha/beta fold hydrolase [Acinetobacter radioresistens]|uniref:alpha/beta fold hydrolase n=1 Tax=Acinetobacter radioresistens TaxID=40216 RepID=UPI003B288486
MPLYRMHDGENLYVRRIGRGQPVLVLSGLGMQSWQWLPFIARSLNRFEFIIPDWRGFGGSRNCAIPQSLDAISSHWQDVSRLINQLQLDNFILIAYSMGATTAMHGMHYANLGDRLKAYLHIDQTPKILADENWKYGLLGEKHTECKLLLRQLLDTLSGQPDIHSISQLETHTRTELLQLWYRFVSLQGNSRFSSLLFQTALKKPKLQKYLLPLQRLDYLRWYLESYLYHTEDYREALSQLECPVTFFIGQNSSLYAAEGQTIIAKSLKNAHPVYFEHSGHTPLLSEPVKFTHELRQFLLAQVP